MKYRYQARTGFTLIELLIVVLIIGILAAVALPMYNKSVEKSRAAEGMTIVSSLAKAGKMYMMETGNNPWQGNAKWSDLDVQYTVAIPDAWAGGNQIIGSGNWYCGFGTAYARCARQSGNFSYAFYYYFDGPNNNLIQCSGFTNDGKAICNALGLPLSNCSCQCEAFSPVVTANPNAPIVGCACSCLTT